MTNNKLPDLVRLSGLSDYDVAGDSPDVRGWTVSAVDGPTVGRVRDLIVDVEALRARYIEVEPEHSGVDERRTVLFPVASARIDNDNRSVIVSVHSARVENLPAFTGLPVAAGYDTEFDRYLDAGPGDRMTDDRLRIHRRPAGS